MGHSQFSIIELEEKAASSVLSTNGRGERGGGNIYSFSQSEVTDKKLCIFKDGDNSKLISFA